MADSQNRDRARPSVDESRYRAMFDAVRVALWEEDFSVVADLFDALRRQGVVDLRSYLEHAPERVTDLIQRVRVVDVNAFAVELFEAGCKEDLLRSLDTVFLPETVPTFVEELVALWNGQRRFESETVVKSLKGRRLDVVFTVAYEGPRFERSLVSILDNSAAMTAGRALQKQTLHLEALNRIAKTISSDLDLHHVVQTVTDAATDLIGARYGAFFYNDVDEHGEGYTLFTLSGAPRSAFEKFGLPRNTALFEPTFRGIATIRSDDIRADPRYGRNSPHRGMPEGHLPVVSYLAVPVISRSGEVLGGLFFGHDQTGVFTAEAEELVTAIAAHAAIAIDNSHMFQEARTEIERRRKLEQAAQRLAAIVESSDDAIVAKDLDGIVTSWNDGAERLFGYSAEEMLGNSILVIIPEDRLDEEATILARIRRGERVDHYETIRRRKDGSLVHISLTVSPIRDPDGNIAGASKIARDISERRRAEERQQLLLREMRHRIKNVFALCGSLLSLSAPSAESPQELASAVRKRLGALARASALTMPAGQDNEGEFDTPATLHALIHEILLPFKGATDVAASRVSVTGADTPVSAESLTALALLLHEFATNAAKYGALSTPEGHIDVESREDGDDLTLWWTERGGPRVEHRGNTQGFGSILAQVVVEGQLGGRIARDWKPDGLSIRLSIARDRLSP